PFVASSPAHTCGTQRSRVAEQSEPERPLHHRLVTQRRRSSLFQFDERSWIAWATDLLEVPHEIRFWINELGSEDLSPNLYCASIIGDGLCVGRSAKRNNQIFINEMMFDLV